MSETMTLNAKHNLLKFRNIDVGGSIHKTLKQADGWERSENLNPPCSPLKDESQFIDLPCPFRYQRLKPDTRRQTSFN